MPSVRKATAFGLCGVIVLLTTTVLADPIYRYIDKHGTPNYTDRLESIPEQYRGQVDTLDSDTLRPFKETSAAAPSGRQVTAAAPFITSKAVHAKPGPSWFDAFEKWQIPRLSDFQAAVGSTAIVLTLGGIVLLRMSSNSFVRFGLKFAVMMLLGGSVYAMYFSGLNERITALTGESSASQTVSGKDLLREVTAKTKRVTTTIQQETVDRFNTVVNKTTDSTIGEARRTVQRANEANEQLQKHLDEITAINTSPASGERPETAETAPSP